MKKTILIILMLIPIIVSGINFHIITEEPFMVTLDKQTIVTNEFEIVEITTFRDRDGLVTTDIWQGVRFTELIRRWTHLRNWDYEIIGADNYFIRLNIEQIALYNPIIAISRNGYNLPEGEWRFIAQDMPIMYWVSHITDIKETQKVIFPEPSRTFQHTTVLNQVRLYVNPEPFTNSTGYKFSDIISIVNTTTPEYVKIVSKDGLEQVLPYQTYLRYAILAISNDSYSIQSMEMPNGMWQKNIYSIQTNDVLLLFEQ